MTNVTPIRPPLRQRLVFKVAHFLKDCRCKSGLHNKNESEEKFTAGVKKMICGHCGYTTAKIPGFLSEQRWTKQLESNLRPNEKITTLDPNNQSKRTDQCFSYEIQSKPGGILLINCSCGDLIMLCHDQFRDELVVRRTEAKLKSAWRTHSGKPDPFT